MCFSRPAMVIWERMRKHWTEQAGNHYEYVKTFFNTFISKHPGYQFTVAQKFDALYDIGITWEQYDQLKLEVERGSRGLSVPEIKATEYLNEGRDKIRKSFSNLSDYRRYKDSLRQRNIGIVRSKLQEAKQHSQQARSCYESPGEKYILSFDIEVYEYDFSKMLEIGYVIACVGSGSPRLTEKRHFIIRENLQHRNGDHCADNRDGFRFGRSETVPLRQAIDSFRQAVVKCTFLLAHSAHSDDDYLRNIGVDISELGKKIMDTQQVEMHLETTRLGHRPSSDRLFIRGLIHLLKSYSVQFEEKDLHNAGCDAYYTMKLFLRQMGCSGSVVNALT